MRNAGIANESCRGKRGNQRIPYQEWPNSSGQCPSEHFVLDADILREVNVSAFTRGDIESIDSERMRDSIRSYGKIKSSDTDAVKDNTVSSSDNIIAEGGFNGQNQEKGATITGFNFRLC